MGEHTFSTILFPLVPDWVLAAWINLSDFWIFRSGASEVRSMSKDITITEIHSGFFWLGWGSITACLPNTEALWQRTLLLRKCADRWAAQQVDPLLLQNSSSLLWLKFYLCSPGQLLKRSVVLHRTTGSEQRIERRWTRTNPASPACYLGLGYF